MTVTSIERGAARHARPRRVAMISVHTSPLDQPGTGDAGGMNVYVVELARRLAELGTQVDVFTRATSRTREPVVEAAPGVLVRHVEAGPHDGLTKAELPGQLCTFAREVLRIEAEAPADYYDLVHSHYWLSGQVGALARDRWGVPLVHSMHTMAKVKNANLADGDAPEPRERVIGEEQVVQAADLLVANTAEESDDLARLYDAPHSKVAVVQPGVDLRLFSPGESSVARTRVGLPTDAFVVSFAGRIQPLKGPDVVVRAAADLVSRRPDLRPRLVVSLIGGPSGTGLERPADLADLAETLGVRDVVRFVPPVPRRELADHLRASSLVCVPSYHESFGLVAIEAQACGVPVVAAGVGGLPTAVRDGITGALVDGHDPADYSHAFERLLDDPARRARQGMAAAEHAQGFGWERTAESMLQTYARATALHVQAGSAVAQ